MLRVFNDDFLVFLGMGLKQSLVLPLREIRMPGHKGIQNLQSRVLGIKELAKRKLQNCVRQSIESLAEYLAVSVQSETPQSKAKANYVEERTMRE